MLVSTAGESAKPMSDSTDQERRCWLSLLHSEHAKAVEMLVSSHGLLLQIDVERAFIAGAWASVIVLAQSVIEATVRDLKTSDYRTKPSEMFQGKANLERVRALRNELVHPQQPGTPSLLWVVAGGDYAACHAALEEPAKAAMRLMVSAIYAQDLPPSQATV